MSSIPLFQPNDDLDAYLQQIIGERIAALEHNKNPFLVPRPQPIPTEAEWQHFHLSPEMFIQIGGSTHFSFPNQEMLLEAGQSIILPRQLAHQEQMSDGEEDFCNIVVIAYKQRLSYHITMRDRQHERGIHILKFARLISPRAQTISACMDEIVHAAHSKNDHAELTVRSYSLGLLSTLLHLIQNSDEHLEGAHPKIAQCLDYIDYHIGNNMLCVNVLASWLGCHPDYLSKLFHQEQGTRLNNYISEKRIALAKDNLHATDLPIAQIALSSGFQDPAYFSRIFKKRVGCTPQSFRSAGQVH